MSGVSLGFWFIFRTPLSASERAERVADLLTDKRWPWQPNLMLADQRPGQPMYAWRRGKIRTAELRGEILNALKSDLVAGVHFGASHQDRLNHAWFHLKTGQPDSLHDGVAFPLIGIGMTRTSDLPAGKTGESWLELVHDLVEAVDAAHGVIWAGTDERPIVALQYGIGSATSKRPEDYPGNENWRVSQGHKALGDRWVRPPAWGTYLKPEHVAAVGGRDGILDAVKPPVLRLVGGLLYIQLSSRVEDALLPETQAKRKALVALLDPITVPRVPLPG